MRDGQGSQRFVAEAAVTVWAFLVGSSGRTQTPEGNCCHLGPAAPDRASRNPQSVSDVVRQLCVRPGLPRWFLREDPDAQRVVERARRCCGEVARKHRERQ